jgi:multimeric flavodoxin WrbA
MKKKVTAFVGTPSKKHTCKAVRYFLDDLESRGGVESEIVVLSDYNLGFCRGCKACFSRGEAACPLKDDRDALIGKMEASDGVVFATPNFSFHVSGQMKVFLDRLGFIFHRPRFFGKVSTSIVAQGIYGGHKMVSYLDFVGAGLGFNTLKGTYFTAFEPMTGAEEKRIFGALKKQGRAFHKKLMDEALPAPSWLRFMGFRMGRTAMRLELDERSYDYRYYRDRGWFASDYFYATRLGPLKRIAGPLFDSIQGWRTNKRLGLNRSSAPGKDVHGGNA